VLAAQLGNRHACLSFPQKANDLFFSEPLLQVQSPLGEIGLQNHPLLNSWGTSTRSRHCCAL
jgi:hypothetical protein